jgi:hypothetical protein
MEAREGKADGEINAGDVNQPPPVDAEGTAHLLSAAAINDEMTTKPIHKRPMTSNKFGRGKRRGGDRKSAVPVHAANTTLPAAEANDADMARDNRPQIIIKKKLTKAQIIRCLNTSKKKRQSAEDKFDVASKKLHTATNECKTLAALAQERPKESNYAFQRADSLINGMHDEMTTRLRLAARDVAAAKAVASDAVAHSSETSAKAIMAKCGYHYAKVCATYNRHAKQLSLHQRDFDVVVKDLKRTSKRQAKSDEVVIGNQAAMINHLETKVASAELSVHYMQNKLEKEHREAISDLVVFQRSKVRDLKYCHVTNLAEEKKKLQIQLHTKQLRQSSLCNKVLDYRQHARAATKVGTMSIHLSYERLRRMKEEWRLKGE